MPVGNSGRVVIELDPVIKAQLHNSLREQGTNLKEWFLQKAHEHLDSFNKQTGLFQEASRVTGVEK